MEPLAAELQDLVDKMLKSSAGVLRNATGPMLPTILVSDGPSSTDIMTVIDGGTLDSSLELARETADRLRQTHKACLLAWDGYATAEGLRTEAILMKLWHEGRAEPLLLAQRYTRKPFSLFGRIVGGGGQRG